MSKAAELMQLYCLLVDFCVQVNYIAIYSKQVYQSARFISLLAALLLNNILVNHR